MSGPIRIDPEDFLSTNSSSRGIQRAHTATWNYVATVRRATVVTHSCVGSFTGPNDLNLILCKGSHVEIYLMIENELHPMFDFPVADKVVFLELVRRRPATEDFLYIATQSFKLYVLQWDAKSSKVITISTTGFPLPKLVTGLLVYCQGGTICPRSSTIVLYANQDCMWAIPDVNSGAMRDNFSWRCGKQNTIILDVKFLYGHNLPTMAFLYKGNNGRFGVKLYEVIDKKFKTKVAELPDIGEATLLIPVHQDPYGFLIIGREVFYYVKEQGIKTKRMGYFNIKTYGRFRTDTKKHSYLLGDHSGSLLMLQLPELTHRILGRTSIPSSISYLRDTIVFVGSCSSDSQLIKIIHLANLQVLKTYANVGPINDFCVINKSGGQRKILMCCGSHEESALEVFYTGTGINPKKTIASPNLTNVWPLKASCVDDNHKYLVVQTKENVISVYIFLNDGFVVTHDLTGFTSGSTTLCCHNAIHSQFIQVTEESVRLISSKTGLLKYTWPAKTNISCAAATATQILLATGKDLVYLEIGDGILKLAKEVHLECNVACLDISNLVKSRYTSKLAAVATWLENKVRIFLLKELTLLAEEQLSCLPRCILLCTFGEFMEPYVLCGLGDGTLYSFQWKEKLSQLQGKCSLSLGPTSHTLRKFSSNGENCVLFSTSSMPSVVLYKNKMLQHEMLNLTNILDSCPFHCDYLKDGVVVIRNDGFVFCTLGDIAESGKVMMASCVRRICHQEETQSYAIIVEEKQQMKRNHILLLDDNLNTSSTFKLDKHEVGLSIVNSRFASESLSFYCVGTSFNFPGEADGTEGRIRLFVVLNGKLILVTDYQTDGAVHYLKSLYGGLLVNVSHTTPRFYELVRNADDILELHENPGFVELGGVEERFSCMYSLSQKVKHDAFIAPENRSNHTAIQMTKDGVLFSSDARYIIVSHSSVDNMVGRWYSGEFITQIKVGTLSRLSDEDYAQVPSVLFSTATGAVGVIVSLPSEVYSYLEKFERKMRSLVRKRKTYFVHFMAHQCIGLEVASHKHCNFIDGDYLEAFKTLSVEDQADIAGEMLVDVLTLKQILKYLALFH